MSATACTRDTNTQHENQDETKIFPMNIHLKLHATQFKQLTQTQTYPLHDLKAYSDPPRNMKATIFHSNEHTSIIISKLEHLRNVGKTSNIFTLPSPHNTSVLEKEQ